MKNKITALLAFLFLFLAVPVYAGAIENVVIDENGIGTWTHSETVVFNFSGSVMADPSGGTINALVYDTNVGGNGFTFTTQGDYNIYTPGATPGEDILAGVVRFYNGHYMIFYDNDIGAIPSLADVSGMPSTHPTFNMDLYQTLVGDPESATVLTPVSGMAGYVGVERQYTFLSVIPVPEPTAISLLACSVALLALRRKRPMIG